jgi:hypothetical protein
VAAQISEAVQLGGKQHRGDAELLPAAAGTPCTAIAAVLDRPKKQRMRLLKAECPFDGCEFVVRVATRPVKDI